MKVRDPASIAVFPDGHRPRVVKRVCTGDCHHCNKGTACDACYFCKKKIRDLAPRVVVEPDPALVRAVNPTCGAVLAWEQLHGLLIVRGKADRRGRTVNYYHARCPTCGAETRQQRAPTPGQTCEQAKR